MAINKKLGKGLSSLLGSKENNSINRNFSIDEKGLLLVPIEKIYRDDVLIDS